MYKIENFFVLVENKINKTEQQGSVLASIKDIIKSKLNVEKSSDIHPLTRIRKQKKFLKLSFIGLLLLTFVNIGFLYYLERKNENNVPGKERVVSNNSINEIKSENKNNIKNEVKTEIDNEKNIKEEKKSPFKINDYKELDISVKENINIDENIKELSFTNTKAKTNKKSSKKDSSDFDFYYKLAKKLEKKGDKVSALAYYRKAYKLNQDQDILYKIAYLNLKLKGYYGAKRYSTKLIKQNPYYEKAYIVLYKAYLNLKKKEKAKLVLEEAYYKLPNSKLIAFELARLYMKEGNIYSALEIYENFDNDLKALIEAGKLYEILNEKQMALSYYKRALNIDNGKYTSWLKDKIKKLSN